MENFKTSKSFSEFNPRTLQYIVHINEILDYLDLSLEDKKNIYNYMNGMTDGVYFWDYKNSDHYEFENLHFLIDFSIDCIGCIYEFDDSEEEREEPDEDLHILKSLEKFKKLCPENLYIQRQSRD